MADRTSIISDFPGLFLSPFTVVQLLVFIVLNVFYWGTFLASAVFLTGLVLYVTLGVNLLLSSAVVPYQ